MTAHAADSLSNTLFRSRWWLGLPLLFAACAADEVAVRQAAEVKVDPDDLLVVDCLLPGQLRKLGQNFTYLTQRLAIKTSAVECEIRGGEYVAYDRANYSTSLKIWLPKAQEGDAEAQAYVGEIYEKGMGIQPDYGIAYQWYRKAAEQGHSRAQINLGYLYESGLGVPRDLVEAMNWYRKASGLSDGELEFVSSIEAAQREATAADTARLKTEVTQLRDETAQLREQIAQRQAKLKASQGDIARLSRKLEEEKRKVAEAVSAAAGAVPVAVPSPSDAALEKQLRQMEQERQALIAQLAQQQAATAQLRDRGEKADAEIADRNRQLDRLRGDLDGARAELARVETLETGKKHAELDLIRLQSRTQNLQAEVERQQQKIAVLEQGKREAQRALESQIAATGSSEQQLLQQLQARDSDLAALRLQLAERDSNVSGLERELDDTRGEQERLNAELRARQEQIAGLRKDLAAASRDLEQRQLALATTRDELNLARQAVEREKQLATAAGDSKVAALEARIRELDASLQKQQAEVLSADSGYRQRETGLNAQLEAMQARGAELELDLNSRNQEVRSLRAQLDLTQKRMVEQNLASTKTIATLEAELQQRQAELWQQKQDIEKLQSAAAEKPATAAASLGESAFAAVEMAIPVGPTIEIIEPPVAMTRGTPTVRLRSALQEVSVIGRVAPVEDILSFRVNDRPEKVDSRGLFQTRVPMQSAESPVRVVAVDKAGLRTQLDFLIHSNKPEPAPVAEKKPRSDAGGVDFGTYHALVIGNDSYQNLPRLRTARNDARAVAQILETKYGFKTTLLLDADRYMMLSALNQLRKELNENSNLLIYYAGHGELDSKNFRGYWLPVDSESDSSANWVSNVAVTDILNVMAARHVLVVADSCYSGTLTRSSLSRLDTGMTDSKKLKWYEAMAKVKARLVLSSGGVQPVLDSGGGQHSVFAKAFLDVLRENDGILEGFNLYRSIQTRVKANPASAQIDQNPQYAPIKFAGHEAGEFLFPPVVEGVAASYLPDDWHLMFAKTDNSNMQQVPEDVVQQQ